MYIHFKRILQVENVPERFKHREWSQTHHCVMGAGATKNASAEEKWKETGAWWFDVDMPKVITVRSKYLDWREGEHFVMGQCMLLTFGKRTFKNWI